MSPFQAFYGRLPPLIPAYSEGTFPEHEVDQALLTRDELLQQLKTNLEVSINRMKQYADANVVMLSLKLENWFCSSFIISLLPTDCF